MKHIIHKCDDDNCQACNGGYSYCTVCGLDERYLTTDCPEKKTTLKQRKLIEQKLLNYKDLRWKKIIRFVSGTVVQSSHGYLSNVKFEPPITISNGEILGDQYVIDGKYTATIFRQSENHKFYNREDGLLHCAICGGAEGSLPTECPGMMMTEEQEKLVYARKLDYICADWETK